ncbi:hypothetical protein RhiirA4_469344 [Rhizophagus irregularis]|uniref:Ubiquitin-like domain-containing protein n=1 Tax=Rhizophagus irregularis TaxID=588596 RepID=A0A2I1GZG4_9GLOM|nr:hypothetical protein RhiirA4_469344 [Rhizophagus irregularis]
MSTSIWIKYNKGRPTEIDFWGGNVNKLKKEIQNKLHNKLNSFDIDEMILRVTGKELHEDMTIDDNFITSYDDPVYVEVINTDATIVWQLADSDTHQCYQFMPDSNILVGGIEQFYDSILNKNNYYIANAQKPEESSAYVILLTSPKAELYNSLWKSEGHLVMTWPFSKLVTGESGSGKTNLLGNLVLDDKDEYVQRGEEGSKSVFL